MKPYTLILVLGLLATVAKASGPLQITFLQPDDGLLTHRPTLDVAVRLEGSGDAHSGEENDVEAASIRRLELYLGDVLVAQRAHLRANGGAVHFTVPLRRHMPGPAVLRAVAWPETPGAQPVEAHVDIDLRRRPLIKDLSNPDDDDDLDGLTNGEEVFHGTDPSRRDTDIDAFWDSAEVEVGSNPLSASSIPALTVVAAPPAAVVRRQLPTYSALELGSVIARPPASVSRRELPDWTTLVHSALSTAVARPTVALARREPIDTSQLPIGIIPARPPVRVELAQVYVFLVAGQHVPAAPDETVTVPLELLTDGAPLASLAFSLNYDADCLDFDGTDGNSDGLPDALAFALPPGFSATVFVDPDDHDGELDVFLFSNPVAILPSGPLAHIDFRTTCAPAVDDRLEVPVAFSFAPKATFGDVDGQDIPGATIAGSVDIFGGLRGDCNSTGAVTAADLPALVLDLFDGDGDVWLDTPGGTFAGNPVGCDANADTGVDAGDLSCTGRLLFDLGCTPDGRGPLAGPPRLVLSQPRLVPAPASLADKSLADKSSADKSPAERWVAELRLEGGEQTIASVALSLDLDFARLGFDPRDDDGDGMPDAVRFHAAASLRSAVFDPADSAGELDVVLANLAAAPLADGVLLEIELTPFAAGGGGVSFAAAPAPSFGGVWGERVDGESVVEMGDIFSDGFESGGADRWSRVNP